MPNLFKLFKKPKLVSPLPSYPHMDIDDIPDASTLIFYGSPGNKATELVGSRLYGFRYNPPPFHAALYLSGGEFLNVGKFREIMKVEEQFKNTRRVDVIVYKLDKRVREDVKTAGSKDISRPRSGIVITDYGVTDFLRFGIKWFRPSKNDICSENVVENFNVGGFNPTDLEPYNTAPWDLVEWAEAHPEVSKTYTLHEGDVFKEKLGRK